MSGMRTVLLLLSGLAALAAAWMPLVDTLLPGPFTAHMASHMLVVAVAAPLLAAALARTIPRLGLRLAAWCPPVPASLLELLVVWGWHAPALHEAARMDGAVRLAEQASFFVAGFWLWATTLARDPSGRLARGPEGILALLLTATHMTLLGVLLALAPRPLFAHDHGSPAGPVLLADQELGGVVMLTMGGIAYLAGGLVLLAELLRAPPERGFERREQREGRCA
ncbi:cytochrome c oxidase assembly protein [Benzoatithermus flavus]|uniref:Cytochrome c oxidase assembly protein n=1 Tax=Benzoatithermus flavus TaxID=3108223 RepID=A0ABU8XX19_9PROT